jgi:cytochrome c biogenesis protein CcmG, thiol:disulfide interchange protein DsbE
MEKNTHSSMWRYLTPLFIFALLVVFLYKGLSLNPRQLQSTLIDKPAPNFSLPSLKDPARLLNSQDLLGEVWLLNVWASWCVSCRQEHPLLMQLSKQSAIKIYGLNYKDKREDAQAWLARHGDPYLDSAMDSRGRTGIDYGVTGTPETFLIDKHGIVRYKYVGPLATEVFTREIWPLLQKLLAEPYSPKAM